MTSKAASNGVLHLLAVFALNVAICDKLVAQENPYELQTGHPRLIMTKYDELAVRFILMEDPLAAKLKVELKKDADALLDAKNIKYQLDRRNTMLGISREYLKRIVTLSLAYRIFERDEYSDKAIEQMMYVCSYPDWNPQHFLDAAEMTTALAIGYDWNYYHLNVGEKETIRNNIVEKGLYPGLDVYEKPDGKPHVWFRMNNNWNQVCTGGLILGALAVGEDFPDLKNNLLYQGIKNLLPTLDLYIPDGVWYEGPAYWGYANVYLAMMLSALQSSLEHDFRISERPGLNKTADFYVKSISPAGQLFNFADASSSRRSLNPALSWFAKHYGIKGVSAYFKKIIESNVTMGSADYGKDRGRLFYLALPWFDDDIGQPNAPPKAAYFRGPVELLFLRGPESGHETLYLATKGGKGTLNHQQLDVGTFVVESDGVRWGIDLGSENYYLPDFFQKNVGGKRWTYYRNTNKSHSTLVIGDEIQYPDGLAKFVDVDEQADQPYGILDMSEAYPQAAHVERGYKLLDSDHILIRDQLKFDVRPQTVRWGMMTDADIELGDDRAALSKNGKNFYLQIFASKPLAFSVEPARAYHEEAKDNFGKNLLFFEVNKDLAEELVEFSVVMGKNFEGLDTTEINSSLESW